MAEYDDVTGLTGEQLNEKSRNDPKFNPRDALWQQQKGQFESRLRSEADKIGWKNYDMAELGDIERWVTNEANSGKDASPALEEAIGKIKARGANNNGPQSYGNDDRSTDTGGSTSYTSPSAPTTTSQVQYDPRSDPNVLAAINQQNALMKQMYDTQLARENENKANRDRLYEMLMGRAKQSLDVSNTDPLIRRQSDTYAAQTDRSARNYLADLAESAGPMANLAGERRMMAEKTGIANAGFEAELMARELTARRQEIADALNGLRGMLTSDQQLQLQQQLGMLDNLIKEQQLGQSQFGLDTGRMGANNQLMDILLGNSRYYAGLNSAEDQFAARLGFDAADRGSYWDWMRTYGKGL